MDDLPSYDELKDGAGRLFHVHSSTVWNIALAQRGRELLVLIGGAVCVGVRFVLLTSQRARTLLQMVVLASELEINNVRSHDWNGFDYNG